MRPCRERPHAARCDRRHFAPEFKQDLARDIAARLLDRGRIGEADCLSVLADTNLVLPFGREAFGSGDVGRGQDLADTARNEGLEAFAETLDPVPADTIREGVNPVVKSRWSRSMSTFS